MNDIFFGTGDPKLMAGGISQALVTTTLGTTSDEQLLDTLDGDMKTMVEVLFKK